jgi:hypothetical protein
MFSKKAFGISLPRRSLIEEGVCPHNGACHISVGLALLNRISQRRCNASRGKAGEGRGGLSDQAGRPSPRPTPVPTPPAAR